MVESPEQRLAQMVLTRRQQLKLGQDLGPHGGPSAATVRLIEKAQGAELQRGTKIGLERALDWAPGSVDAVWQGGDPTVIDPRAYTLSPETVRPDADDAGVLLSMPPEALEGLDAAGRAEVIAAAKLSALQTARDIRRRLDR